MKSRKFKPSGTQQNSEKARQIQKIQKIRGSGSLNKRLQDCEMIWQKASAALAVGRRSRQ